MVDKTQTQLKQSENEFIAAQYGTYSLRRYVYEGQNGYLVTSPENDVSFFHVKLESALRSILSGLGHSEDRDIFIMGGPDDPKHGW